ncbi:murein hydrolase activator EnvC [Streptomyces sp. 7-21]|uniref:murein hydrolase activator EnvC family protein n=1 Tax=Streptomyces sp. 7-21 TaxID=2802283 RepID=UPI00191FA098|nr:M23 family metallopeptidase [Streptomyces sp. 7-21]MBL1068367.1 M23 family metallopeptidase [Streptomyces sp. 7-21]
MTTTVLALTGQFLAPVLLSAALLTAPAAGQRDQQEGQWPVAGSGGGRPLVARGFEAPAAPWAAGHRGVDLAAARGAPVRAVAAGTVVFAGEVAGRGVVSVELPGTGEPPLRVTYEPVLPQVTEGERVRAGQRLGTLGPDAYHCPVPCLHLGLRRGEGYHDPLSLLPLGPARGRDVRLLPVTGVPEPG